MSRRPQQKVGTIGIPTVASGKKARVFWIAFVLIIALLIVGAIYFLYFRSSGERKLEQEKSALPSPIVNLQPPETEASEAKAETSSKIEKTAIPDEVNLNVPFTVQAPNGNWDKTHEEACEEAAMLMTGRFFESRGIGGADEAEAALQEIIKWENEHLGFFESTTAEETVKVIEGIYGLKTEIISNPTVDDIKTTLAENKLVIVPAAGRQIGNPFYKQPGPLYHMLLLKGYTKTQFITNDAGTKRGANYPYNFDVVLKANHDWNGGDVDNGAKRVIVVSK